jgi:hypothetical protein
MSLIEKLIRAIVRDDFVKLIVLLDECEKSNCNLNQLIGGQGPIHLCSNSLPQLILLVKYGADPNLLDLSGLTVLDRAMEDSETDTIPFLLEHGARIPLDIISRAIDGGTTPEAIELLLKAGAYAGNSKTRVEEILSHDGDDDYELDGEFLDEYAYDRYREILELLDRYDPDVKYPDY